MAYDSDMHFNNVQLMKLVSSAELIFQHLYGLVSNDTRMFIDQWFCFKHEYDETRTDDSQFDVNENVQECPILARIDEVSENEKVSSISSASMESMLSERADELNENDIVASSEGTDSGHEDGATGKRTPNLAQLDSDLLDYMTDFKLFTDSKVSDWFKTLCVNMSEIKQYMSWLENRDYESILTDSCADDRQKFHSNNIKYDGPEKVVHQVEDDSERRFIPIETCPRINDRTTEVLDVRTRHPTNCVNNFDLRQEEVLDQHIRYLQEIRKIILSIKQDANKKLKNKKEVHSKAECHSTFVKADVAVELIDLSIEMKNQLKLGHHIQDLTTFNDKVDAVMNDTLHLLTLNEIRHLLFNYFNNVIAMRKCSSEHDKQVSELDREISNQKFLIWRLYMIIHENKRTHENLCLTMRKDFEQKLQLTAKTTTDESNDESVAGVSGRALLPIMEKNSLHESTQSESRDVQNAIACIPHIPEKNLKALQSTSLASSSSMKVKRDKTKLIIKPQKN